MSLVLRWRRMVLLLLSLPLSTPIFHDCREEREQKEGEEREGGLINNLVGRGRGEEGRKEGFSSYPHGQKAGKEPNEKMF